jgi:hypothetical protein
MAGKSKNRGQGTPRGRKPERLRIEGDWKTAVGAALKKPIPQEARRKTPNAS